MKKKIQAALVLVVMTTPVLTMAGPEKDKQPIETTLDEVVVTASRSAEQKRDVSASITVINSEELRHSGSNNVGDLLAEKGVGHIKKYPGSLTSIGIRGFRTESHGNDLQGHVLILLDGRRAGTGNVAKLLTKNVERVEIVRGPGAVQYGSAGMGGVVNIITRQGDGKSLFVDGGIGSFGEEEVSLGGTALVDNLDFSGSVTYRSWDDYTTATGDRYTNTAIDSETGISANLGYSFAESHRLGLVFNRFNADNAGSSSYFSNPDLDDSTDKENYSLDLKYTGSSSSGQYQWLARYFRGQDENSWLDPVASDPSGYDNGVASTSITDQMGAQLQMTGSFGPATVTGGLDWLDYEVENSWNPKKTTYNNPALFLLAKSSLLNDKLIAHLGLRHDWYEVEVKEPVGTSEDQSNFTPSLGLTWLLTDNLKLRAQYAQGFRMPSAKELAYDLTSSGRHYVGNPNLDPEKSKTYEGGADFAQNGLSVSLTYFYTDFEDKIVEDVLPNGDNSWQNLGDATIAGLEGELSYDIGVPLQWDWEVRLYLSSTVLTDYEDDSTGEDLQYISGTNYSTGLVLDNGSGLACRLNAAYTGSQGAVDYESGWPYQDIKMASFTVVDFTTSILLLEDERNGSLTLRNEVCNLFNEEYAYVKGYPAPGRSFFMGLRWDY